MKKHVITIISIFFAFPLISQDYSRLTGKEEYIAMGDKKYRQEHYPSAIFYYERAFKLDAADTEVLLKLAHSCQEIDDIEQANKYYELAERTGQSLPEEFYLNFAETLLQGGHRDRSAGYLEKYASISSAGQRAENRLRGLEVYDDFFLDTLSYKVSTLDVNTSTSEVSPMFYGDDIIYLSSQSAKKGIFQKKDHRTGRGFYRAHSLKSPDETVLSGLHHSVKAYHQGPMVFFNGESEAYSTENVVSENDHIVRLKLFHLSWDSTNLSIPPVKTELPFNLEGFSTGHPATNEDGSLIIFASDMPFGYGGTDLYLSRRRDGVWTQPENLGEIINTPGDEMFPFLSGTDQLYFASNGHAGLGGLDILRVNLKKGFPVINPGAPLNSRNNDFGLIINEETDEGYFSSNRREGKGDEDLYHFNVYRIEITARMINRESSEVIDGDFTVKSLRNGEEVSFAQMNGNIVFKGLLDHQYEIKGRPDALNEVSKQIMTSEVVNNEHPVDLLIDPTDLVRPVQVTIKLIDPDNTPFEGEVLITELGGRGQLPLDRVGDKINFKGLTKTDYTLVSYGEGIAPFMTAFHTRDVSPKEDTMVYEFYVDQGQRGGTLLSGGKLSTPSRAPGQAVLLTFNSGGPEENWLRRDSTWIPYEQETGGETLAVDRVRIGPLYFDTDQSDLREEVRRELDHFYTILSAGEIPELLITGYTDIRGTQSHNTLLSWERAKAVKSYLVALGYSEKRISTMGLGESDLASSCEACSHERYQLNRRVTFTFR